MFQKYYVWHKKQKGKNVYLWEEELEETKGVIKIRILKKNKQHSGQKKMYKQRSTKHTHKIRDRVTWTTLKTGMNSGAPEGLWNATS